MAMFCWANREQMGTEGKKGKLLSWSLTALFSTNMAISEMRKKGKMRER